MINFNDINSFIINQSSTLIIKLTLFILNFKFVYNKYYNK